MSKVYVFGIGGTGSRVLRSLTLLLASGVDCGNDTIVPIIIDPDASGGDLTRTVSLMRCYSDIRKQLVFDGTSQNEFFKTEIDQVVPGFQLPLDNKVQTLKFQDYMGVSSMTSNNQCLMSMLFSDKNLSANMNVGFKGNPNIGSVVLNQFSQSEDFKAFANNFQQGDRIFIISSIFGGTGASGFPLLLKTLRSNTNIPNFALINNAIIGGITVLPYFNVKQDNSSEIDSTTFISKTKSALAYYDKNISGNNSIDALYYVADDINNAYDNHEGGGNQKNDAHMVELISALAIIDFVNNINNRINPTIHKEFGIKDLQNGANDVILSDFAKGTEDIIKDSLISMFLFAKYNNNCLEKQYEHQPWAIDRKLDRAFFRGSFYKNIEMIQTDFFAWLGELSSNKRKLTMFELGDDCELFKSVKDYSPKKSFGFTKNYALIDKCLNKQVQSGTNKEQLYINLFYSALKEVVSLKF
ncbi:MAG: hypothetical protein IJZ06_06235 [Bacteroidales bacterium]|nr:hypothetical protein [Bacteroidales bacterium]